MEHPSFLLLFLLAVVLSVHIHARESKFFSKTVRTGASETSIAEEPSTSELALPPQSHNGYGLYGHDNPDQFPSTTTTAATTTNYNFGSSINGNAYKEPNSIPSTLTNAEFSAQNYKNNERNYYDNNDSHPTSTTEQTYEKKVSSYPYNYDNGNRHGTSDTRFMDNGKYFYDVNKENYDEPMNSGIDSERSYGSYANNNYGENARNNGYDPYKNDLEAYLNSKENQESETDYIDP